MGKFAKKSMAAIGVAVVVIAIAAIAIGRMDRKVAPKPVPSNNAAVQKPAPPSALAQSVVSNQVSTNPPVQSNELKRAVIRKETFGSASTPQHSAAKVAKPQHMISVRTQAATADSTADANSALQSSASVHASTSRSAPTQAQVAQSQPPVFPPDTATPPAQQSTLADIVAVTMQVSQSTGVMKTTGKVDLNGIFKNETALVYPNNKIVTPGQNGALVTAPGNAIVLGANAQFTLSVTTTSITNNRSVQ